MSPAKINLVPADVLPSKTEETRGPKRAKLSNVGNDNRLKFLRIIALPSLERFLAEYTQLNRSGSRQEAIDSFYKYKLSELEGVLSRVPDFLVYKSASS